MIRLFIFFTSIAALFFTTNAKAQTKEPTNHSIINTHVSAINIFRASKHLNSDDFGQTLNSAELSRLPFHNINSIANTVTGVNSYGGGIPNIKGAPASGTAYFVDGVRVYGALPNLK